MHIISGFIRDSSYTIDSMKNILGYQFAIAKTAASWFITKRFSVVHTFKAGINADLYKINLVDSIRELTYSWKYRWNYNG